MTNRNVKKEAQPTIYRDNKNDEIITDKEIDEWKWKSDHKIDVELNTGNGR